jgi:TRAP transporter TAXI family solute receptor
MAVTSNRLFARSMDDPEAMQRHRPPPTLRSIRRRITLIVLAGTLALVGLVSGAYYFAMRPVTLRIAVGPPNSDDAKVVQALTQTFSREHNRIRLRPITTENAVASATALADGKAELAVIRGDLNVPKNAQAVATLRKNVVVVWVPGQAKPAGAAVPTKRSKKAKDEGITKISQLTGKRIGVIGRTLANVNLLKVILAQYGVDPAKVEIVQFSTNEIADAVRGQKVDVFMAAGPVNSRITIDAISATSRDGAPSFLPVDLADAIAQNYTMYESSDIPAGAFGGAPDRPEEEVKTISFSHHIAARQGVSDATIAAFTRQLFAVRQSLIAEFPQAAKIETPDTDKDAAIPVHPGAAAYVDGEEKTFLDRYSDYIWFTLIALSAMGSASAWFASYLRRDERNVNSNQRDRLLDMLQIARKSDSSAQLDEMQAEADQILRDTLTCYENGVIEQGSLNAFNIALEQFHNAVADRKALMALDWPAAAASDDKADQAAVADEDAPQAPAANPTWPPTIKSRPQVA